MTSGSCGKSLFKWSGGCIVMHAALFDAIGTRIGGGELISFLSVDDEMMRSFGCLFLTLVQEEKLDLLTQKKALIFFDQYCGTLTKKMLIKPVISRSVLSVYFVCV